MVTILGRSYVFMTPYTLTILWQPQLKAVIMESSTSSTKYYSDWGGTYIGFVLTKDTPHLTFMGKLWGVCCEGFGEKWHSTECRKVHDNQTSGDLWSGALHTLNNYYKTTSLEFISNLFHFTVATIWFSPLPGMEHHGGKNMYFIISSMRNHIINGEFVS